MKVKLLNDGKFNVLREIKFPCLFDVDAENILGDTAVLIPVDMLIAAGARADVLNSTGLHTLTFFIGSEVEVIS